MPSFKCIKSTTLRGRQVIVGVVVRVTDKVAGTLKGHPCWEKTEAVKVSEQPAELSSADKFMVEKARKALLGEAVALGLNPRNNTGIAKLEAMVKDHYDTPPQPLEAPPVIPEKIETPEGGNGEPGSIV